MKEKQIVVGEYENELDAEISKGHLESSRIDATIIKGGGMLPSLRNTVGVQLVVTESQSEKAEKILQAKL
jgi:hypothetical protein